MNIWLQKPEEKFIREIGSFFDLFEPFLVYDALLNNTCGLRSAVFGWDVLGMDKPSDDPISKLFGAYGEFDLSYM